jgi:fimbrial chaperone protein
MAVLRLMLGIVAATAAFGLSSPSALAGTFSISPLRAELSAAVQNAAFTMRNPEPAPVVVQAQVLLWEQQEGVDRLTPTRDVMVSPAVFTIPASSSQLVRVALRRPVDPRLELSYRLLLTEVPQSVDPQSTGLSMALQLSLPVFVEPSALAAPRLEWTSIPDSNGVALTARNTGTSHARIVNFTATPDGAGEPVLQQNIATYILPGQARTWTIDNKNESATASTAWHRLGVKGTSESGDFEVEARPAVP